MVAPNMERETERTLQRLLPRVQKELTDSISADPGGWQDFTARLEKYFPPLFNLYLDLYGTRYDFFFHLEDLIVSLARAWFARAADLRALDQAREANPLWFQSNQMLGGVCYVDLFAGDLEGLQSKIPYFQELGLTYLHLMPLFKVPAGENDGGYAVSSYREIHPPLGTMEGLSSLARELRKAGISLVVDLVFNHTSDEHTWAERARAGDEEYAGYYRIFPSRELPDRYEQTLREIFPDEHPGAFTLTPLSRFGRGAPEGQGEGGSWVWSTFHSYQWDLNYANPAVFNRMAEEMLFLANQGVEVIRLDAVAFIWKEMGTNCENLPGAHKLIRAFNAVARISAPAMLFKSEAIVHPDEVVRYIHPTECQLSYNPLLMALLWNSVATRKVRLLSQALATRFKIHPETAWVNYVRVHDDIGWTFSDEDAAILGVNGYDHRRFLNEFYRGRFEGSFARGLPFQENPKTGDCRISGTCASLAGLERALNEGEPNEVELAIRRILLIHGVILTAGGIPLIYLGDEIGTLNDYSYRDDPAHERDSRWVHRPRADWEKYARRHDPNCIEGRVYLGLQNLIALRKANAAFSGGELDIISTGNDHVLSYVRTHAGLRRAIVITNFSETPQTIPGRIFETHFAHGQKLLHGISQVSHQEQMTIEPLDFLVFGI
ncbi:MAG TPA: alpha-amylase family protein [Anaerolineales bacterium]|nr:alpha-amylase family protein [Anaerolineales bacterium]